MKKFGERLRKIVATVAPTLGTALGGPLGGLAGKVIKDALGVESDREALQVLEQDPDALLKLKQAEIDFEARMRELEIDEDRLHQEDRDSARRLAMNTSIAPQLVISGIFVFGYFVMIGLFFSNTMQVPESDVFKVLIGMLTVAIPQILQFWFGSSKGSQLKDLKLMK